MITRDLNHWGEFEGALRELNDQFAREREEGRSVSKVLFRGQRRACWTLSTTLERYNPVSLSYSNYYRAISSAKPEIEAYSGRLWEIEPISDYEIRCRDSDSTFKMMIDAPGYEYMAYLRHHGFPSPLLDWSRSPYVAAFFAFRDVVESDDRVAIYGYREHAGTGKVTSPSEPSIIMRGPYIRTHKRHFIQQCGYTVCGMFRDGQWRYVPHDEAFMQSGDSQDVLWKCTLPSSDVTRVLDNLDEHNINAYSLFGSEDALMETMAARELDRANTDPSTR